MKCLLDWAPVAAWLGFLLSVVNMFLDWWRSRTKVRLAFGFCVIHPSGNKTHFDGAIKDGCSPAVREAVKTSGTLDLLITNMSLHPIYIERCVLSQKKHCAPRNHFIKHLQFFAGDREGKAMDGESLLTPPFRLASRECVKIIVHDLIERLYIAKLIEDGYFYICIRTSDGKDFTQNVLPYLQFLLPDLSAEAPNEAD